MVAETAMNAHSTRSHCIFFITIERVDQEHDLITRSVLTLVDLAGSERLQKSSGERSLFNEGRSINLSLHYLEQVIVALGEKGQGTREHIPYRNSVLTHVLRDSLGGNCLTALVATISMDPLYYKESLSTCRFSQRVGLVKNSAQVNTHISPQLQIANLSRQIHELKEELQILRGTDEPELTSEQLRSLRSSVQTYLESNDNESFVLGSIHRVCSHPYD